VPSADGLLDANGALLLLSSLCTAASEAPLVPAGTPLLVQYGDTEHLSIVGYSLPSSRPSVRFAAETVFDAPDRLCFFDGLFPVALSRFRAVSPIETRSVVRFSYYVSDWALTATDWREGPSSSSSSQQQPVLLWGPQEDPVSAMHLSLEWCHKLRALEALCFCVVDLCGCVGTQLHIFFPFQRSKMGQISQSTIVERPRDGFFTAVSQM